MQHLATQLKKKKALWHELSFGDVRSVSLRSGKVFEVIMEAVLIWGRVIKEHSLKT